MKTIRVFLLVQILLFWVAAAVHAGVLIGGWEHREAATAETVIGSVLLVSLVLTFIVPERMRIIALVAQTFALIGTLVGLFTIAIGVGPRTTPDLVTHALMIIALVMGLRTTKNFPKT